MSVHQINELVKKNLNMNFLSYAKCIVEKFDVKSLNAVLAMHDYIKMIISSNIEIEHFLKLSESFFNYCDVKAHLMVLGYIITKLEWGHFQDHLEKMDNAKVLNF